MRNILLICAMLLALSACKTTTDPLYYHGEYNKAVYSYLTGDSTTPQEQIAALQTIIQDAAAKGKKVAPGIHAHLGLLYFNAGSSVEGEQQFAQEKALFPESAQYLDFLLKSKKGA